MNDRSFSPLISYQVVGTGSELVLIHGDFATGALAWGAQVASLSKCHRLVIVDRRGYGASTSEPRPYSIASDAVDVLAVADAVDATSFHLAGHSYGGLVALELALRAPGRVRSLHLIEPPYLALQADDPNVVPLMEVGREIFHQSRDWDAERTTTAFFTMIAGAVGVARLRERSAWPELVRLAGRIGFAQFPGDYPADRLSEFRPNFPVVVYTGGRSHPGLRKIAQTIVRSVSSATLVEIADAFHDVQRNYEPFNRALLNITRAEPTGPDTDRQRQER